jgi:hypothetical protein
MKNKVFRMWVGFQFRHVKSIYFALCIGGLFVYVYPFWWTGAPSAENIHHVGPVTYWR